MAESWWWRLKATTLCPCRHQGLDTRLGQALDLVAIGGAVVRRGRLGHTRFGGDRRGIRHQLITAAGAVADPRAEVRGQIVVDSPRSFSLAGRAPGVVLFASLGALVQRDQV